MTTNFDNFDNLDNFAHRPNRQGVQLPPNLYLGVVVVASQCLHGLYDSEIAIRSAASTALRALVHVLATTTATSSTTSGSNHQLSSSSSTSPSGVELVGGVGLKAKYSHGHRPPSVLLLAIAGSARGVEDRRRLDDVPAAAASTGPVPCQREIDALPTCCASP